jgi:glycogen operon protein
MVAHDGMTLKDLYACNGPNNNQPWPYGPSDGGESNNHSWDQGGVAADQRKAARNGLALLMLSGGTPMITGGDEALRTQWCNNNAYNLDSDKNWLNYSLSADQSTHKTFAQRLMEFRKAHPALRPAEFYKGLRLERERDGADPLVQGGRRRGGRELPRQREQPRRRLAH